MKKLIAIVGLLSLVILGGCAHTGGSMSQQSNDLEQYKLQLKNGWLSPNIDIVWQQYEKGEINYKELQAKTQLLNHGYNQKLDNYRAQLHHHARQRKEARQERARQNMQIAQQQLNQNRIRFIHCMPGVIGMSCATF